MELQKKNIQPLHPSELPAWNAHFQTATPEELLRWAAERWDQRLVLTCSFGGAAGMVLLDMLMQVAPKTPVVYIDTGLLFPETYNLIDKVEQRYGLRLRGVRPRQSVVEQARLEGDALWQRDPDRCCGLRKVQPLADVLAPYDAWITGIRRDGGQTRANATVLEWSNKYRLVKLNPLAYWGEREIWSYIFKHDVPYNPLLDQGYRSIGCHTCTRLPTSDDPRSGRWAGFNKTECGLHVETT
jgi:phosphoadenosine phosphosulfate reductase